MAKTIYDVENFATDIETILKANLNTKITEINTEKGDFEAELIDDASYIFQTMNEEGAAFDPFLFWGEAENISKSNGPDTAEEVTFDVLIIKEWGNDSNTSNKLFRWRRALKEIFEKNWDQVNKRMKITVSSVSPEPISTIVNGEVVTNVVLIGVQVKAFIA